MSLRDALRAVAVAAALFLSPAPGSAQEVVKSPILTVEADRLFNESLFGQRLADEVERAGNALSAENRRIEAELTAEEKALTEQRATLPPAEFRRLADAFDEKVQTMRQQQDAKTRALGQRTEEVRRDFLTAVQPVLGELMREAGAAVLVERRNVFLSADAIDITDEAIARVDARLGTGTDQAPAPDRPPQDGTAPDDTDR